MKLRLTAAVVLCAMPVVAGAFRPFVRGSWQQLRQSHSGQPLIAHFWGLSCAPCVAELPQWAEFVRQRKDLALVLVAADPVPAQHKQMAEMLMKAGLGSVESWMFADPFSERVRFEVDPDWAGELPFTVLITRDGKSSRLVGVVDFAAIRAWTDAQRR